LSTNKPIATLDSQRLSTIGRVFFMAELIFES
jgi:hypothetical protein